MRQLHESWRILDRSRVPSATTNHLVRSQLILPHTIRRNPPGAAIARHCLMRRDGAPVEGRMLN